MLSEKILPDWHDEIIDDEKNKSLDKLREQLSYHYTIFDTRYKEYLDDKQKGYMTWRIYDDLDYHGDQIALMEIAITDRIQKYENLLYQNKNIPIDLSKLILEYL